MSEKHGQLSGAQWTTKSAAAASPTKHQQPNPNPSSNSIYEATATSPYGIAGGVAVPPGPIHTDIPTYSAARFQAPPLHMHPHSLPAKSSPLTIVAASPLQQHAHLQSAQVSPSTPTNVPVPSGGFVPPVFPNMTPTPSPVSAAAGSGAATSVLTPNPFAAASAAGNLAFVNAFNLTNATQLDLGKIMHVMNANAVANAAGSPAAATAATVARPAAHPPAHPHPSEVPAAVAPSGAINSTIAENVMSALSNDDDKMRRVQQVIEASLDDAAKLQIAQILESVAGMKPIEKLFLYLRLPSESADTDPLRQPQNPLGTRSEINHTINWVRSHLEHDAQVSIPKQDVYNDYIAYCERLSIKPLSTADFGKVMKQVFPGVRPRRLGTRGNSRYCYAAMRKTTKLTPPQLPQLCKDEPLDECELNEATASQLNRSPSVAGSLGASTENDASWDVVRTWAEKLLNTKLDSVAELASRIKCNNAPILGGLAPKKYTPREPKEKRLLADMGPLKKRRKKKRKGSTSSESSCNQPNAAQDAGSSQEAASDDHKTEQLLKIKQEIIDSPCGYTAIKQPQQQPPPPQQQQQQQMLPMNLATEPRSNAVRNLTPKLMELQTEQAAQQSPLSPGGLIIKDEAETEEYNTSNIFCKKVLKAQQTKGFWANSPSSGSTSSSMLVPPVITTTAATPPPPAQPPPDNAPATVTALSMGPPAQLNHQSSVSPSSSLDTNSSTPKVASRNMMLLRAKRIMAENSAALAAAEESDLPENLGLPRERVISICNMDKHELDDYFLPGVDEEENSEGPDTELLQYFPIGDAEEKQLNSLDAQAEQHRNPQATTAAATALTNAMAMATAAANARSVTAAATATTMQQQQQQQQQPHPLQQQHQQQQQLQQMRRSMQLPTSTTVTTAAANVVGSASASLALMSRKHQQQQQQHQQLRGSSNNSNKRKISLTNASSNGSNKNCIFLPISPNTNSSNTAAGGAPASANATGQATSTQNCFASPGLTRMRHRSSLLTKQQSLDFDNNGNGDPMIGAGHRRRRNYVYSYPSSSSASAPPSPSLLQQCMGANWSFNGNSQFGESSSNNNSSNVNNNVELLVNQNSMDLETSLALTGANIELNETQRSQSVPLSQLQRSSSNHSPATNSYNRQLTQAVTTSIVNDALFSENSNSQQSKLGGNDVDVSTSLLYDDVDVSTLISPSFNSKFTGIQTTTTCSSSAGSSSGYSSAGSAAGGIVSRSVPSTPLPHQQSQQQGCNSNSLNTTNGSCNAASGFFNISPAFNWTSSAVGGYGGQSYNSRTALDISKSMPTTPITTPCFRYSPVELHRDFLINGNTIDSLPSPAVAAFGTDAVLALSTDTLIDDAVPHSSDVEAM
ncbi:hypothetical protein KR093_001910, partial [Drosophila rubida]